MAYGGLNKSMDAAAEIGRNPVMSKHQIQSECGEEQTGTWDGTAEPMHLARPNSQARMRERGQANIHFPRSADHEQDWQPYPIDPYSAKCDDHTYYSIGLFFAPDTHLDLL